MIDVSVVIPVYNHEKFLKKAIDSVLMQKINFNLEVLIAEDCSTDGSRAMLKAMENNLPNNYTILYRENNYGIEKNFDDLYARMQGRYYIVLEADDYWISENKLQKQYDFLENNPDYLAVAHNSIVVDENDEPISYRYPECRNEEYTMKDFQNEILPGQTTTIMRRNYMKYKLFDYDLEKVNFPGDQIKAFLTIANGKVHCIQEQLSAYRLIIKKGSSFSAQYSYNPDNEMAYRKLLYGYVKRHPELIEAYKCAEKLYVWFLFKCLIKKHCGISFGDVIKSIKDARYSLSSFLFVLGKIIMLPVTTVQHKIRDKKYAKATGIL